MTGNNPKTLVGIAMPGSATVLAVLETAPASQTLRTPGLAVQVDLRAEKIVAPKGLTQPQPGV